MTDNTIQFRQQDSTWVMRITADRRIEVNEDVEVTEAANKVLEAMQWMLDKQKRTWVGLTDEEIEQMGLSNYIKVVRETEAKLKEKNEQVKNT